MARAEVAGCGGEGGVRWPPVERILSGPDRAGIPPLLSGSAAAGVDGGDSIMVRGIQKHVVAYLREFLFDVAEHWIEFVQFVNTARDLFNWHAQFVCQLVLLRVIAWQELM